MTRTTPTLREDTSAAAQLMAFSIGIGIFLAASGFLLLRANLMVPPSSAFPGDEDGSIRAEAIVSALLSSGTTTNVPGNPGWDATSAAWNPAPAPTDVRVGLGSSPDPNLLLNMAMADRDSAANDRLDYEEMREALGLDATALGSPAAMRSADFHLRIQPRLPSLATDASPDLDLVVWYLPSSTPAFATAEKAALDALLLTPSINTNSFVGTLCNPASAGSPDVIVAGSGATLASDPWTFTQADLEAWIADCGGTLIVLGGDGCGCLPTTMSSADPVGGPAHNNDPADPILQIPNAVGATRYTPAGTTFAPPTPEAYTVAARSGATAIILKSRDGAFGAGQVLLLQANPSEAYGPAGPTPEEAQAVLHNLLAQHYTPLFLDYGPPVPDAILARPAFASALVDFAAYPLAAPAATATVDVVVWVFPHAGA